MIPLVADTGPLNYLIQIKADHVLPFLFNTIFIPTGVLGELRNSRAPEVVRKWAGNLPAWCQINSSKFAAPSKFKGLSSVDLEVLSLSGSLQAVVAMDDLAARSAARQMGIPVIGTIGILELAAAKNLIMLTTAFDKLRITNIRVTDHIYAEALVRDATRRAR